MDGLELGSSTVTRETGTFYHTTSLSKARRILRRGLLPEKSFSPGEERLFVYLWDDVPFAIEDSARVALRLRKKEAAILEVRIPKSWTRLDDRYYPKVDAEYGHAWKVARRIPASRISLWQPSGEGIRSS